MRRIALLTTLMLTMLSAPITAQPYPPCFDFASIMKNYYDDNSGLLDLDLFVVGFAPEGPFNGEVGVINSNNDILGRFKFQDRKFAEDGVFANVRVEAPAQVTITTPGIYNLVFLVEGKQVTRFPFVVHKKESGDAFNPETTYAFDGLWRSLAYLTMDENKGKQVPKLNFWTGGLDLPEGASRDLYTAELVRGGKVVATSKKALGFIPSGHFKYTGVTLFHPHDDRQAATAPFFTLEDWAVDGKAELRVTRHSDGALLRSFNVTVKGGEIQKLPRTKLGYEPALDFISPRVPKMNSSGFQMIEGIWLEDAD